MDGPFGLKGDQKLISTSHSVSSLFERCRSADLLCSLRQIPRQLLNSVTIVFHYLNSGYQGVPKYGFLCGSMTSAQHIAGADNPSRLQEGAVRSHVDSHRMYGGATDHMVPKCRHTLPSHFYRCPTCATRARTNTHIHTGIQVIFLSPSSRKAINAVHCNIWSVACSPRGAPSRRSSTRHLPYHCPSTVLSPL